MEKTTLEGSVELKQKSFGGGDGKGFRWRKQYEQGYEIPVSETDLNG